MEYIPFPIHISALAVLWIFAGIRGGPFPFKLVTLYSAFFILCSGSQVLVVENHLDHSVQILAQFVTTLFLFEFAMQAPRIKYIKRFCSLMILAIISYTFMFISYISLEGMPYQIACEIYNVVSFGLSIAVIWVLLGVINGSSRGDTIFVRLRNYISNGLLHFRLHETAIHPAIWQKGQAVNFRAAEH